MKKFTINELKSLEFFKHYNRNGVDFIRTGADSVQVIELLNSAKKNDFLSALDFLQVSIERNNIQFLRYVNDAQNFTFTQVL